MIRAGGHCGDLGFVGPGFYPLLLGGREVVTNWDHFVADNISTADIANLLKMIALNKVQGLFGSNRIRTKCYFPIISC